MKTIIIGAATDRAQATIAACADGMGLASVVTTAADAAELLGRHRRKPADLVLADVGFTEPDPVTFAGALRIASPRTDLLLTGHIEPPLARMVLAAGARALICGPTLEPDRLTVSTARAIMITWTTTDPATRPIPRQRPHRPSVPLSQRELEILRGMSEGKTNLQIGTELFIAEDTVKTHAKRLYRKLGVRSRAQAVAEAFRQRLIC